MREIAISMGDLTLYPIFSKIAALISNVLVLKLPSKPPIKRICSHLRSQARSRVKTVHYRIKTVLIMKVYDFQNTSH
jgi:hypothetical protein